MESTLANENTSKRLQTILETLTKFKVDFFNEMEECKMLKEVNQKLNTELKETRELEKSHRYHLQTSREMIGNLQDTVSQLVYLKTDIKKLKDEIVQKDLIISSAEKDKEITQQAHNERIAELREAHDSHVENMTSINDKKLQQAQYESDTKIAHLTCANEELRSKIKDLENGYRDKMSVMVLEYEEKLQRNSVEVSHLQEQLSAQATRTEVNIDAYRRKLGDLEEKLKQTQFKEYVAQRSHSQFENRPERPYSGHKNYTDANLNTFPVCPSPQPSTNQTQNRGFKTPTLQVMYHDNKTQNLPRNENKGVFNISKKRKLYSAKDFLNE